MKITQLGKGVIPCLRGTLAINEGGLHSRRSDSVTGKAEELLTGRQHREVASGASVGKQAARQLRDGGVCFETGGELRGTADEPRKQKLQNGSWGN